MNTVHLSLPSLKWILPFFHRETPGYTLGNQQESGIQPAQNETMQPIALHSANLI